MISRRGFFGGAAALALSTVPAWASRGEREGEWVIGIIPDGRFTIDMVDINRIAPEFRRQDVGFKGPEGPGTIVIDVAARQLFWVKAGARAVRYGLSVGREGMGWQGSVTVGRKAKWPTWTPTANMRARNPKLPVRMAGGPENPLGARALYLFRDGLDTIYRIHGTNEPWSIGKAASSGCFRMLNQHVFELYAEVPVGTPVVVR
jgi:lipoprotein-anchoring transpeptidase ErfK/SrfK